MDYIKNKNLPENVYSYFQKVKNYLTDDVYVYGSIQRGDYFHGLSDIDITIFCENEYSTMCKMQNLLRVNKKDFVKVVWMINGIPVYGYKLKFKKPQENIKIEFAIFNSKFKSIVLPNHEKTLTLPFLCYILLYTLKIFYYVIPIIPKNIFKYLKRNLFYLYGYSENSYLVIKKEDDKIIKKNS